jgi:hypothetical protein
MQNKLPKLETNEALELVTGYISFCREMAELVDPEEYLSYTDTDATNEVALNFLEYARSIVDLKYLLTSPNVANPSRDLLEVEGAIQSRGDRLPHSEYEQREN